MCKDQLWLQRDEFFAHSLSRLRIEGRSPAIVEPDVAASGPAGVEAGAALVIIAFGSLLLTGYIVTERMVGL